MSPTTAEPRLADWYEEFFGEEYLLLYPHRDEEDASRLVGLLVRLLPWEAGWRVLDVACGTGRHAAWFHAQGGRVVGLDLSHQLLVRAQGSTAVPLVRSDVRWIPIRPGMMDLTVNLFTSFGYFDDDDEHRRALTEMLATIRPGGWFVLDFLNADQIRRNLVRREDGAVDGTPVQIRRWLDDEGRHVFKQIDVTGRRLLERVRLFGAGELEAMLAEQGCRVIHRAGDYDGGPLAPDAPRVLLAGRVP